MNDTPSTSTARVSPRDLRVSDEEREHVVGLLQRAIGRGLLNLDEFTERADIAYAALTRGELNVVLADIPGLVHRDAPQPGPGPASYPAPPVAGDTLELTAHASTLVRTGRWVVPGHVRVRNRYGSTRLDFTEAQLSSEVVYVELDTKWGSVEIVIPEGASIDVNAVTDVRYGSIEDKTRSNGMPGRPRLVFSGRVHGGSLKVKHRSRWHGVQHGRRHGCA